VHSKSLENFLGPTVLALWNFFHDLKTVSSFHLRLWSFNSIYSASKILPDFNTKNQIFNNCQIICIEFRFLPNFFAKICRRTAKYAVLQLQRCNRSFHDLACSLKSCGHLLAITFVPKRRPWQILKILFLPFLLATYGIWRKYWFRDE
jgi:hypothetical protein